jgi:hypothetical protein
LSKSEVIAIFSRSTCGKNFVADDGHDSEHAVLTALHCLVAQRQ